MPQRSLKLTLDSILWQVVAVVVACVFVAGLHFHNDGLWMQGDASRHAVNGFFWWDFLTSLPTNPIFYTLRYYARYPVITPASYPPLFHILEGIAFQLFGPSPFVAKMLVLAFAALTAFYAMAWLRRWIAKTAGWAGAFVLLLPEMVTYTHAIMLNIPATGLSIAGLYHGRRWLESDDRRQFYFSLMFTAAAILTYYPAAIIVIILFAWMIIETNWRLLWRRRLLSLCPIATAVLLLTMGILHWLPVQFARNAPRLEFLADILAWRYYPVEMPRMFGSLWLVLGLLGLAVGLTRRWGRREARYLLIWIVLALIVFCILPARSSRYILFLGPAIIIAAMMLLETLFSTVKVGRTTLQIAGLALLGFYGAYSALETKVPNIAGFREAAAYLHEHAPTESVMYDGYSDGIFGFYLRAQDPEFHQRMIRGSKFLYQFGPGSDFNWILKSYISSPEDIIRMLQKSSDCRWLAIEVGPLSEVILPQKILRETVKRPEFELVHSFAIKGAGAERIDIYRFLLPLEKAPPPDLSFPSFSGTTYKHVEPITR